ncbi:hypothetical protein BASA81_007554 [Batrachochytrium salamandrivorans]|nr:hypothetical protein BASA81_007554 [Batrachochytrium salamandrivorans]
MNRLLAAPGRQQLFKQVMMVSRPLVAPQPIAAFRPHPFAAPVFFSPFSPSFLPAAAPASPLLLLLAPETPAATIEVTSILRKRRTKMNKHKLQKRRKLDRRRHLR